MADDYTAATDNGYYTELGLAIYMTVGEGYVAALATIP